MAAEGKVTVQGISGAQYVFDVYLWGTQFNPVGAVYIILKKKSDGNYDLLYVGQTGDLSERFDAHHKKPCFDRNGKSHIGVRVESSEKQRLAIEADLTAKYKPVCNG